MICKLFPEVANSFDLCSSDARAVPKAVVFTAKVVGFTSLETPPDWTWSFPLSGLTTIGPIVPPVAMGPAIKANVSALNTKSGSFPAPHCAPTQHRRFLQSKAVSPGQKPTVLAEIWVFVLPE